jgi:hypothetical protein
VFTYDDFQPGQASGPYPRPPNHVVSIREQRYKLARYYDADGKVPDQWAGGAGAVSTDDVRIAQRNMSYSLAAERAADTVRTVNGRVEG